MADATPWWRKVWRWPGRESRELANIFAELSSVNRQLLSLDEALWSEDPQVRDEAHQLNYEGQRRLKERRRTALLDEGQLLSARWQGLLLRTTARATWAAVAVAVAVAAPVLWAVIRRVLRIP
jgi:hypothetical protein